MAGATLDAREYKLLLDPAAFDAWDSEGGPERLWSGRIVPAIDKRLGLRSNGKPRYKGSLAAPKRRLVQFSDTEDGLLAANGFSLRRRSRPAAGEAAEDAVELTLKLRTPDHVVAALIELPANGAGARSKLEEDIAPLALVATGVRHGDGAILADPPSIHSRFSRSTRVKAPRPAQLGDVMALFPTLADVLTALGAPAPAAGAPLVHGPAVQEVVTEGVEIVLGDDIDGEVAMTFCNLDLPDAPARSAELSWKCSLTNGLMPLSAALRAYILFTGLQFDLSDVLERRELSKTALALPKRVGAP
ncbi:MAG: hypothetical protein SFW09_01785 [Hyphomicrobiaceae bacterium]|nr:hypothetical protein [Hyphomicrobiaceae bacterium]